MRPDNPCCELSLDSHRVSRTQLVSRRVGADFRRPRAAASAGAAHPVVGPSSRLDYELELGVFIASVTRRGCDSDGGRRGAHLRVCLLNDWSARDLQAWEYQPLVFPAKNFATTISPWIVTLQPCSLSRSLRAPEDALPPLPYLDSS